MKRTARYGTYKEQIEAAGAQAVFVAAERRDRKLKNPVEYWKTHPMSFPYLLDEDRAVTKAYGVYHRIGVDALHIARPATFVVDRQGVVQFLYVGMSQTDHMPLEGVLEVVKKLG